MSQDAAVRQQIPDKLRGVVQAILDRKAVNLRVLHLDNVSDFTEYFLICSATNQRQVQAIGDAVIEETKRVGSRPLGVEGYGHGSWVLIDCGDMVIHVFGSDSREVYGLEKLWSDANDITARFVAS